MKSFWQRFLGNPRVIIGLGWLALVVFVALLANILAPRDPFSIVATPFIPPGRAFWLGTDSLGRDVLAGLMHGARTTLLISVVATLLAKLVNVFLWRATGLPGKDGGKVSWGELKQEEVEDHDAQNDRYRLQEAPNDVPGKCETTHCSVPFDQVDEEGPRLKAISIKPSACLGPATPHGPQVQRLPTAGERWRSCHRYQAACRSGP